MTSTIRAIQRDLCSPDGFVWRNEMHGPRGTEGTFMACTFWLVENLELLGERSQALDLFGRASACANDLGLFAEEVLPGTGEPLGNFPQAFSHLGHVLAATRLARAQRRPAS
jgi:GH15 family glucan-1,4-alpha-glucosidase